MNPHDEFRLAEHRHAFLRLLPRRVEAIGRRLHRFLQGGWDINGLALMHEDAGWLGIGAERHGLAVAAEHFRTLHSLLAETLQQQALPDPGLGERLWHLIEDIGAAVPMAAEAAPAANPGVRVDHGGRGETPPPNYWRRWGDDAPAAHANQMTAADMTLAPVITGEIIHDPVRGAPVHETALEAAPDWSMSESIEALAPPLPPLPPLPPVAAPVAKSSAPALELMPAETVHKIALPTPAPVIVAAAAATLTAFDGPATAQGAAPLESPPGARAAAASMPPLPPPFRSAFPTNSVDTRPLPTPPPAGADTGPAPPPPPGTRIYHLTDHGELSLELDQRMEALGYEVELLDNAEELQELLGAFPAHLTLVDAHFSDQLETVGMAVRAAAARTQQKGLLVALSTMDDINLRLSARRAGVDALLVEPNAAEVLKRLSQVLNPGADQPYRVLIVEDDRSQALFAEGILRNAGMETEVVLEALDVLQALQWDPLESTCRHASLSIL